MECGIEQLTPSVESSNFLLRGCELPPLQNLNIVVCYGRSGLCELVCTHVTVGEFAFWNNPADQSGGNAAEGRRWAFEQTFERWQHQYQQCIPSHPMLSNDKQRALPHNTALCLLVLAAEKSGLGGSSHF